MKNFNTIPYSWSHTLKLLEFANNILTDVCYQQQTTQKELEYWIKQCYLHNAKRKKSKFEFILG